VSSDSATRAPAIFSRDILGKHGTKASMVSNDEVGAQNGELKATRGGTSRRN